MFLLTIYKSCKWPHLDYGDVIYDQPSNKFFQSRIESVQYNATLCITTRAHRGSSHEKLHQKRLMGRLGLLYKVLSTKQSAHVHELTHLFPMHPFSLPYGFLMFSGVRERLHWEQMGKFHKSSQHPSTFKTSLKLVLPERYN